MNARTKTIAPEALVVLRDGCRIEGNTLVIERSLERPLYQKVVVAIDALGGKWDRRAKAHVFPASLDVAAAIATAADEGVVVNRKQTLQFFQTPPELARRMVALAQIKPGDHVLEPSAGHGALLREIPPTAWSVVVEIDEQNVDELMRRIEAWEIVINPAGLELVCDDFLSWAKPRPRFDAIVMNPPFAGGQDVEHIRAAYDLLKPGGKLIAVCCEGPFFRENARDEEFRAFVDEHAFLNEKLPSGVFKLEGTAVATRLLGIIGAPR